MTNGKKKGLMMIVIIGVVTAFFSSVQLVKDTDYDEPVGSQEFVLVTAPELVLSNIRVIDGDTVEADIQLPLDIVVQKQSIRLTGYDAWEASKRRRSVNVTDEEVIKGKEATEALKALLASGSVSIKMLPERNRDSYGRVLGEAFVYWADSAEPISVKDHMIKNGHSRDTGELNVRAAADDYPGGP
jgi:endonuclease YncB( thermonuclease family)